jgi:hypothetical protein
MLAVVMKVGCMVTAESGEAQELSTCASASRMKLIMRPLINNLPICLFIITITQCCCFLENSQTQANLNLGETILNITKLSLRKHENEQCFIVNCFS